MSKTVAIVGATGAVGEEFFRILEQREFPVGELRAFSSPRSEGKKLKFGDREVTVQTLSAEAFKGVDIALFSAGGSISKEWCPIAAEAGARVIDNSSAFRMDESVPLVVPEVNMDAIKDEHRIIANPNCTTILLAVVLGPLHKKYGVKRGTVATYQAASGAGLKAMEELRLEDDPVERWLFAVWYAAL